MGTSDSRARLGLVVGGAGVRGFAQAGALAALERAGLGPDVVVGVSTGAVVAAAYAARPDWSEALRALDRSKLPALTSPEDDETLARLRSFLRNARQLAPSVWTWGRQGYAAYAQSALSDLMGTTMRLEEARVPIAQVATDLQRGQRVVLTEGSLATATLAASALPGVASPVEIDGRAFADGGFSDPVPVDVARQLGADVVMVSHVVSPDEPSEPENWVMALVRGMEIGQRSFTEERLAEADIVVRADVGVAVRTLDFAGVDDAARQVGSAVAAQLPRIRDLVGDRRRAGSEGPAEA